MCVCVCKQNTKPQDFFFFPTEALVLVFRCLEQVAPKGAKLKLSTECVLSTQVWQVWQLFDFQILPGTVEQVKTRNNMSLLWFLAKCHIYMEAAKQTCRFKMDTENKKADWFIHIYI